MNDLNDHEQWDAIKAWWKENGRLIVVVVIVVGIAMIGFRYWQNTQSLNKQQASILYDELLRTDSSAIADDLQENYSKTPYASNAALLQAKAEVEKGNLKTAQQQLQWVVDHAKDPSVRQIARLRSARVSLAEHQPEVALEMLATVDNETYLPLIDLVKGDVYLAKGDASAARKHYQNAFNALPADQPIRQYLQMQIDRLG